MSDGNLHVISAGVRWRGQASWWDCACGKRFYIHDDAIRHSSNENTRLAEKNIGMVFRPSCVP